MKIAILLTCFNRKAITIRCLNNLFQCKLPFDTCIEVFLTDDQSSDGTVDDVTRIFPQVHVIAGSGNDFWAGGMRRSFAAALKVGFDFYLWLNDDTLLSGDAISNLLRVAQLSPSKGAQGCIVVGSVTDSSGEQVTYGGVTFPIWWRRTTPTIVYSETEVLVCESFNGNCVLVSNRAASIVGNLDPIFIHGLADFDYGLRARALGVELLVAAGSVGKCERNSTAGTYLDSKLPISKRWQLVTGNKGFPPLPWATFTRRHCGPLWVFNWLFPYARAILAPSMKRTSPIVDKKVS